MLVLGQFRGVLDAVQIQSKSSPAAAWRSWLKATAVALAKSFESVGCLRGSRTISRACSIPQHFMTCWPPVQVQKQEETGADMEGGFQVQAEVDTL